MREEKFHIYLNDDESCSFRRTTIQLVLTLELIRMR